MSTSLCEHNKNTACTEQRLDPAGSGSESIIRNLFLNNALSTEPSNDRLDLVGIVQKALIDLQSTSDFSIMDRGNEIRKSNNEN